MSGDPGPVCVLCGARTGRATRYMEAAHELGDGLARASLDVMFGAGGIGTMGAVADGALAAGGRVEGIVPAMLARLGLGHPRLTETMVVADFAAQHDLMCRRAGAFVFLPGGLGTLYELGMVLACAQLGVHDRPILIANIDGYYDEALAAIQNAIDHEFIGPGELRLLHSFDTVPEVIDALVELRDRRPGSILLTSMTANSRRGEEMDVAARQLIGERTAAPVIRRGGDGRRLHLIYGPTGCGKTDRATALARDTGAPVIVLDRVQCHPEIAVGSARPCDAEVAGTEHVYLCDRPLSDGELPATEAHRLLMDLVDERATRDVPLILEGGSISLLKLLVADPWWETFSWSCERLAVPSFHEYWVSAKARMRDMLDPADGRPGMLAELAAAWPDARARATVETVFTYPIAAAAVERAGLPVEQATAFGDDARDHLSAELAASVCAHAAWQERELPDLPAAWVRAEAPHGPVLPAHQAA